MRKKLLILDQVYPFQSLNAMDLKRVAASLSRKKYKYNDVIFKETDNPAAMYFIVKGQVRIVKAIIEDDITQIEPVFIELCIYGPLCYFGECIIIYCIVGLINGKRFASALCVSSDCELLEFSKYDFMKNIFLIYILLINYI